MLPSAVRDSITRPMPSFERGRTNNIGEGRRSSSCSSSVSRRTVQRSPHPGSGDELDGSITSTRHDGEGDVSIVRPPLGFGRFGQTGSAVGSFGSSSGFTSQQTQGQSIISNSLDGSSEDALSSAPTAIPIQHTMSTILPTKVRPPSSRNRPGSGRSSHPVSPVAHTQSTANTILPTKIRISRGNGYLTETSASLSPPQGPSVAHKQSGILPSKRRTANSPSGHATPLVGNSEAGVQGATSFRSMNTVTPDAALTSPRRAKSVTLQDVYRQAPSSAPVQPPQPSPNSLPPDDFAVIGSDPPPSEQFAPNPNPNAAHGGSVQSMPVSIHNFLTLPSTGYPSGANSRSSTPTNTAKITRTDTAVLPSAYQRKASTPVAVNAKHPVAAKSTVLERNEDPQNSIQSSKKRDKVPNSQALKKRADWRVENYVNSSATVASSNPSQPQFYYSGPHQPAFRTSDPVTTTTVLSGPDARSQFTKTSIRPKTLPQNHASDESGHPNSSLDAPDRASAPQFSQFSNADSPDDGLDNSYPVDVDMPTPVPYHNYRSPSHDSTHNSQLPSRSATSSEPRSTERSLPPSLTPTDDDHLASMDPMESVDQQSTTTTRSEQIYPTTKSSEKAPVSRLVTVIIEDFRVEEDEPFLVEISVPLRTAEDDSFWADAVDVCNILQNGPSRIDGPAKVYTFRGRYRQYFLRVSAENADNYVPANLSVTSDRFLRVFVEPVSGHICISAPEITQI
ncbi:hypothetical protein M0805_006369 [Coniferiporia weirii]|nr:hypothetical protein M0805_006369 [Coniferiporia weirii]